MIAAMVVLYIDIDNLYLTEALTYAQSSLPLKPEDMNKIMNRVYEFRKMSTASLILTWVALMSVKFSFLALFRRLIERMPRLIKYWWAVVIFNLAVTGYGAAVYVVACPHFSGRKVGKIRSAQTIHHSTKHLANLGAVQCLGGEMRKKTVRYALSQLVLDVFGDLLSEALFQLYYSH